MVNPVSRFKSTEARIEELEKEICALKQEKEDVCRQMEKLLEGQQRMERKLSELAKKEKKSLASLTKQIKADERELSRDIEYHYFKSLDPEKYEDALREWYHQKTGKKLDLEHPLTFNEKINWMKLYDSTPLKTRLADKYLVRDWVTEKIGSQYLIPLLGVYDTFDDIDFDSLPGKFVIKTNHAFRTNKIVLDKSRFDRKEAKDFYDKWMNRNFALWSGLQLHYKDIIPKIIIEEYVENEYNNLDDYKVFCFDGKAYYIEYMTGRNSSLKTAFFDRDWNLMPFRRTPHPCDQPVRKPKNLPKMLELAEVLSEGFSHVRVDFYYLNDDRIKFSEMTFTTGAGVGKWYPDEYDRIFGDYIKLPTDDDSGLLPFD